jgi:hypothetical protein
VEGRVKVRDSLGLSLSLKGSGGLEDVVERVLVLDMVRLVCRLFDASYVLDV